MVGSGLADMIPSATDKHYDRSGALFSVLLRDHQGAKVPSCQPSIMLKIPALQCLPCLNTALNGSWLGVRFNLNQYIAILRLITEFVSL